MDARSQEEETRERQKKPIFFIKKTLWNTRERESERTNLEGIEMDPGISANTILLGGPFSSLLASPACNKAS